MIRRLAWVSAAQARGLDPDESFALEAFRAASQRAESTVQVEVVDWHDPSIDWSSYDRVLLGSTWDYAHRIAEFRSWIDETAAVTDLVNPPEIVHWNLDKRYLAELAQAGVPIPPTDFRGPDEGMPSAFPAGDFVVKPAVGAGSRDAASYGSEDHEAACAHIARLHAAGQTVLIQPFLTSIATEGEWPLLFFAGEYSHAASKRVTLPRAGLVETLFAEETVGPHQASPEQITVANAALAVIVERFGTPTYARVDLVRGDDGGYCVLEVELIEPSLFLREGAELGAADRLATAVLA